MWFFSTFLPLDFILFLHLFSDMLMAMFLWECSCVKQRFIFNNIYIVWHWADLQKKHKPHGVQFVWRFSAKLANFPTKFWSWHVTLKISSSWSVNDAKYVNIFLNIIIIPCITCQKEEIYCIWVKYLINAVNTANWILL